MKSFAIKYPIIPQPGKVSTQVSSISFTVPQLTEESRLEAPTPMMAVVFVWVVLTGTPVTRGATLRLAPRDVLILR